MNEPIPAKGRVLNQMSDFWGSVIPESVSESEAIRNTLGSLVAGVIAGYLSHVPHNLSTLRLMSPAVSYKKHFAFLAAQCEERLPSRSAKYCMPEENESSRAKAEYSANCYDYSITQSFSKVLFVFRGCKPAVVFPKQIIDSQQQYLQPECMQHIRDSCQKSWSSSWQ